MTNQNVPSDNGVPPHDEYDIVVASDSPFEQPEDSQAMHMIHGIREFLSEQVNAQLGGQDWRVLLLAVNPADRLVKASYDVHPAMLKAILATLVDRLQI